MKPVVREVACLVIGLAGVVLLGIGLNQVLDIGSCASGGPYEIARPCPEGSDALFWLSMAGALMWIAGIIVSRNNFTAPGAGQFLWTAGFAGGGAAMLIKVLTQESMPPDARLGASIVAAVFIPMGLVVGVVGVVQLVRRRRGDGSRTKGGGSRRSGGPAKAPRDPWSRLKALNDLRSTGALTREEFDALKADLTVAEPRIDRVAMIRQLADQRDAGALSTEAFEVGKRRIMLGEQAGSSQR
ncbi:hypothetical protein F4553_000837 [Allocatelliglobosispora scoriae]|uniref:SHOCT domain-containing protein n=1 Tax=Allocatelliglobosispora scoriae TaxID=643052 RepID=A0A841BJF2_9ACTN|nr:SHOCT domain-containing protein [Allocatelliglobosispora scoriae]MBB5867458.1 hypothetical protein [Allocatelliglobosispora scoriae]